MGQEVKLTPKSEIVGIQYLRGLAAISVVVDHVSGMTGSEKYFGRTILNGFLTHGARGVDLFFLISGFIVCMIAFDGKELRSLSDWRTFISKRFVRVIPMMWLAILSYAMIRLIGRGTFYWGEYVRAFFLIPLWDVMPNQIWTLRHEMIFYILFAVSFLSVTRKPWVLGLWFIAPFFYALIALPVNPKGLIGSFFWILCSPVNVEFAAGFAIGVLWQTRTRAFSFAFPLSPMLIFSLAMIILMWFSYLLGLSFGSVISTTCASIFCLPILFAGVHVRCSNDWLGRAGEILGNASYAIYLFHPHFVSAILGVWSKYQRAAPIGWVIVGTSTLAVLACLVVHLVIERPLLRGLKVLLAGAAPSRGARKTVLR